MIQLTLMFQIYYGICVTITLTASWVTSTHCIKHMYLEEYPSNYILAYSTETTAVVHTNASSKINPHVSSNLGLK